MTLLVEGRVEIGGDRFGGVGAFLDRSGEIAAAHDVTVQTFDANYVVSRRHLERAVEVADRERGRGVGIARDRGVEIALYAAGRRQIDRALEMGLSPGEMPVVVLVDGPGEEAAAAEAVGELLAPASTLGEYDEDTVRAFYGIDDPELEATDAGIEALVLERVALLVVDR